MQVCCTQCPCPCGSPLLTHTSTGDTQTQFCLGLCGGLWVLVCIRFVWALRASLVGMGFDSKCDFTPSAILLGLLLYLLLELHFSLPHFSLLLPSSLKSELKDRRVEIRGRAEWHFTTWKERAAVTPLGTNWYTRTINLGPWNYLIKANLKKKIHFHYFFFPKR